MNSALYRGVIAHTRFAVTPYRFRREFPWWLLDLDEIDLLEQKLWGFKRGEFSLFSFRDHDHIHLGHARAKDNVLAFIREQGVSEPIRQVLLLTNLRTLGYVFNPVSFYFLQGAHERWVVVEIGNTFWEQKPLLMGPFQGDTYQQELPKEFYISPFLSLSNRLRLTVHWPTEKLSIHIDDLAADGEKELTATFVGTRQPLSQHRLLMTALRFPLLCFTVMAGIHWHALKLWLKGVPFIQKSAQPELQRGLFRWKGRKFTRPS